MNSTEEAFLPDFSVLNAPSFFRLPLFPMFNGVQKSPAPGKDRVTPPNEWFTPEAFYAIVGGSGHEYPPLLPSLLLRVLRTLPGRTAA